MCKVLALVGVKEDKQKEMWKFLVAARPFMTANDRDGVGYAALSEKGLFGERWFNVEEAWDRNESRPFNKKDAEFYTKFKGNLEINLRYNRFGAENATGKHTSCVIYHSRHATCDKTLANTHPFVKDDTALIHNGVISNTEQLRMESSTCDSETILNEYIDQDVANNPEKIVDMSKNVFGSYGCAVITKTAEGKRVLDVFRHTSMLYASYIEELGATIFCTSDEIIKSTCRELKFKHGHMFRIKEEMLMRFDAVTGDLLFSKKFEPMTFYQRNNKTSSAAGAANAGESSTNRETGTMTANTDTHSNEGEKKSSSQSLVSQEIMEMKRARMM